MNPPENFMSIEDYTLRRNLFIRLDFIDVTNLGCTNKYLQYVAQLEFMDRFEHRKVSITNLGGDTSVKITKYEIQICGFEFILNFLKAFGPILKGISYTAIDNDLQLRKIVEESISNNCSKTLHDLMLCNISGTLHFNSIFAKVERLIVQWSVLPSFFCEIDVNFPNIKILQFDSWNQLNNSRLFLNNLSKLKVLTFGKELNVSFFSLKEMYPNLKIKYHKRRS